MKPENVNPKNFELIEVIYESDEFSIAYGVFEKNNRCIGMRWNGNLKDFNDKGYPKVFNNPMWFIISEDVKIPFLKSLLGLPYTRTKELLNVLSIEL